MSNMSSLSIAQLPFESQCGSIGASYCYQTIAYQSVLSVHMKNCDPFEFGPEFAMERIPGKKGKLM